MRLIYTDEAGTAETESVAVVAAVIVKEGDEVELLESEIDRIISERVPEHLRSDFHIHATDIFQGTKGLRDGWSRFDRLDFLKEVASLPFIHDIPIALSYGTKQDFAEFLRERWRPGQRRISSNQYNHFQMFASCMDMADLFLRKHLQGGEEGRVLAEAVSGMQGLLQMKGLMLRDIKIETHPEGQVRDLAQQRMGEQPAHVTHHIECIVDRPEFFSKGEQSILQIADIIAFGFRRFAEKQTFGAELVEAILGPVEGPAITNDDVWFSASNHGLFCTDKYLSPEALAQHQFRLSVALGHTIIHDGFDPDWERHLNEDRARADRIEAQWGDYGLPRIPHLLPTGQPLILYVVGAHAPVGLSPYFPWPAGFKAQEAPSIGGGTCDGGHPVNWRFDGELN